MSRVESKLRQGFNFPSHVILILLQSWQKLCDIADIKPISDLKFSNETYLAGPFP